MLAHRAPCLLLMVVVTSCTAGADPSTIRGAIEEKKQEAKIAEIKPPPQPISREPAA